MTGRPWICRFRRGQYLNSVGGSAAFRALGQEFAVSEQATTVVGPVFDRLVVFGVVGADE